MVASPLKPLTFCLATWSQGAVQNHWTAPCTLKIIVINTPAPATLIKKVGNFLPLFYFCREKGNKVFLKSEKKNKQEFLRVFQAVTSFSINYNRLFWIPQLGRQSWSPSWGLFEEFVVLKYHPLLFPFWVFSPRSIVICNAHLATPQRVLSQEALWGDRQNKINWSWDNKLLPGKVKGKVCFRIHQKENAPQGGNCCSKGLMKSLSLAHHHVFLKTLQDLEGGETRIVEMKDHIFSQARASTVRLTVGTPTRGFLTPDFTCASPSDLSLGAGWCQREKLVVFHFHEFFRIQKELFVEHVTAESGW